MCKHSLQLTWGNSVADTHTEVPPAAAHTEAAVSAFNRVRAEQCGKAPSAAPFIYGSRDLQPFATQAARSSNLAELTAMANSKLEWLLCGGDCDAHKLQHAAGAVTTLQICFSGAEDLQERGGGGQGRLREPPPLLPALHAARDAVQGMRKRKREGARGETR